MPEYTPYPRYYDLAHDTQKDIPFYMAYAGECGSPILELACGTGRLLIPLLEAGYEVHGLDLHEEMLEVCRQKLLSLNLLDRAELTRADMADFELERKDFSLALIPLRSFAHLFSLEDQKSCLKNAFRHLRPGGICIVAMFSLRYSVLAQEDVGDWVQRSEFELPDGNHVIQEERFLRNDLAEQTLRFQFRFSEFDPAGQKVCETTAPMDMRYVSRFEMELLMESAGFEVTDVFRDYEKRPYDGTWEMIMVGEKS
jgi:ubiquinone/menaquinone biosynthesis C-methylase UbiE